MRSGIIIVDKPEGWTSHDVVAKLRGALREKRIGHGGTLDPMATGVLPVFIGRATRTVEYMEAANKTYIAELTLGVETDTQDTTGAIIKEKPVNVDEESFIGALKLFTGSLKQVPPMYSAVKKQGKKLYELARKGIEIERDPRDIFIHRLEVMSRNDNVYRILVRCSKGTYIRTLCHDIGRELGCGGAMSSLRRISAGSFDIKQAFTLEEIIDSINSGTVERIILSADSLFSRFPAITIDEENEKKCRNGAEFAVPCIGGEYRVYSQSGEFLMIGEADRGLMHTVKSFFEVN